MTRLLTCGWETGVITEAGGLPNGNAAIISSGPAPPAPGFFSVRFLGYVDNDAVTFVLPTRSDMWFRFNAYLTNAVQNIAFFRLRDSAGAAQGCLTYTASDQALRLYRGADSGGTLLANSFPIVFAYNQWHLVEVHWKITDLNVGDVQVWIDGTLWFDLPGIDNTNAGTTNIGQVVFGCNTYQSTSAMVFVVDDVAVNDTTPVTMNNGRIGDGRVVLLKPNGVGSSTTDPWLRGGTDTGANWSQVNEQPASMAQYVRSQVIGDRDLYTLADVPLGTWSVNTLDVVTYAKNGDVGTGGIGLTIKSDTTINEGPQQLLTTTATLYRRTYDLNPHTGLPWTVAEVNLLEAGVTVR